MTQLTTEHIVAVCQYLIDEAETAAADHRALASHYRGSEFQVAMGAAEEWDGRAGWIREVQSRMTAQLERPLTASSAA